MEKELATISREKEEHIKTMSNSNLFPQVESAERKQFPGEVLCEIAFSDVHMHIENMPSRKWRVPEEKRTAEYLKGQNIVEAGVIFEKEGSVNRLLEAIEEEEVSCNILPFYFIHDPRAIDENEFGEMYERGKIRGIKLHPVYDRYEISYGNCEEVLKLSQDYLGLPILMHLDDRKDTMHLTSPEKLDAFVDEMLERDTVVSIILGHSGAYAHPRLVSYVEGSNPPVESYWKYFNEDSSPKYSRIYLIKHALQLALEYPFIYLDTSSCVNKIKAKIIAEAVNAYPELSEKILLGTDYPVLGQYRERGEGQRSFNPGTTVKAQLRSLWQQGLEEKYLLKIASNRLKGINREWSSL
jgi:predicted TIM-barrel fold metal-dependent hydrolase